MRMVALLALCVLALQMLACGQAEVAENSALPLLLRPNMQLDPGAVVIVGQEAHQQDVVASAITRLGIQSWINESPHRITFKRPDLKLNFAGVNAFALDSLKVCDMSIGHTKTQGVLLVSVGGPDVNMTTKIANLELPVKLIKDYGKNQWTIVTNTDDVPHQYYGDEYGIIAFVPEYTWLNSDTLGKVTNGTKQLGTVIVAGNGREGTLAAAVYLRDILTGKYLEGRWVSRELDKILIWMISGEEQRLHPVVVIVKSTGEDTAEVVDYLLF
ncbi:MAG: hypothetical protein PVF58_03445 [Candidatus Methanofastidiosia archaeon]